MFANPTIYNRENLKPEDRKELDFWFNEIITEIIVTLEEHPTGVSALDDLISDIQKDYAHDLIYNFGVNIDEVMVSLIDGYPEDVPCEAVEEFTTYTMKAEDCLDKLDKDNV